MCAGWGIFDLGLKKKNKSRWILFVLVWLDVMWFVVVDRICFVVDLVWVYGYWCAASLWLMWCVLWLLVWWKFDHRRFDGSLNAENRLVERTSEMFIGNWWVEWADDVTNSCHGVEPVRLTLCEEGMRFGLKLKILKGLTLDDVVRCQVENIGMWTLEVSWLSRMLRLSLLEDNRVRVEKGGSRVLICLFDMNQEFTFLFAASCVERDFVFKGIVWVCCESGYLSCQFYNRLCNN